MNWKLWMKSITCTLLFPLLAAQMSAQVVDSETKLVPSFGAMDLEFASDVAIDSNTAAVGALQTFHGSVYIYTRNGTNWTQTQILTTGATPLDTFGRAVALSDNSVLAVGQPTSILTNPAAVFIFTNNAGTWSLQQTLIQPGPLLPDGFGSAVDLSETDLAVGDPFESSVTNTAGAVFVYTRNGSSFDLQATLRANDPSNSAGLGSTVSIDRDTVLAGTIDGASAAYVFVRSGTTWTQQQKLVAPAGQPSDGFGGVVAVEGDIAAVTGQQTQNGTNNGAIYVFTRSGTTWSLQQILSLPGGETNFIFANSLAIHNGVIAAGLPGRTVDGLAAAGSVVIFQFNGTSWQLVQEVAATDAESGAFLGSSIDFGNAGIIAGAPGFFEIGREGTGAAYIFSLAATNPPVHLTATASPNVLFPPNRKFVPVTISVSDNDGLSTCRIVSVSSNQSVGKGKKAVDWIVTGDLTLLLRAERDGGAKAGRIYTITIECTDGQGNTAQTTTTVTVPHDASGKVKQTPAKKPALPKNPKKK